MGKIKQGILGGFSGKVANVIGSSWKGIAVMKSMPLSVANPRTAKQVVQRTKFSAAVALAVAILALWIKPLWDRFAQKQSGFNAFVQANVGFFNNQGKLNNPNKLIMAKGKIEPTHWSAEYFVPTFLFRLMWSGTPTGNQLATDIAHLCLIGETDNKPYVMPVNPARSAEMVEITWELPTDQHYTGFLVFRRADGTQISDQYINYVEPEG